MSEQIRLSLVAEYYGIGVAAAHSLSNWDKQAILDMLPDMLEELDSFVAERFPEKLRKEGVQ